MVAEGDELFLEIIYHLRRLYTEVYSPAVSLSRAPERREFPLGEGEILSGGTSSVTIIGKLGAYAGRFNNISPSLAGTNKPSLSLTNAYLYTPLVGPTPDPQ